MNDSVLEFINRRFVDSSFSDANWLNGNCYYFALILKDRFKSLGAEIYYDVIHGHFITLIDRCFYDASGVVYKLSNSEFSKLSSNIKGHQIELDYGINIVNWNEFELYDSLQFKRINQYCLL